MKYSDIKRINTENIGKEKRKPGLYILLNSRKNPIYVGSSTQLKHRLKAILYGRADYNQVQEKRKLRKKASYYKRAYMEIDKARKIEKKKKQGLKFNIN